MDSVEVVVVSEFRVLRKTEAHHHHHQHRYSVVPVVLFVVAAHLVDHFVEGRL